MALNTNYQLSRLGYWRK